MPDVGNSLPGLEQFAGSDVPAGSRLDKFGYGVYVGECPVDEKTHSGTDHGVAEVAAYFTCFAPAGKGVVVEFRQQSLGVSGCRRKFRTYKIKVSTLGIKLSLHGLIITIFLLK